jgi:hypothetical protein
MSDKTNGEYWRCSVCEFASVYPVQKEDTEPVVNEHKQKAVEYQSKLEKEIPVTKTPIDKQKPIVKPDKTKVAKPKLKAPVITAQTPKELKAKADRRKLKDKIESL